MADFKWKLTRPGIELEFETGSVAECIGLLEQEGTEISKVFGFTMGSTALATGTVSSEAPADKEKKVRKPRTGADPSTAVAPDPLPIPGTTTLPPNTLNGPAPVAPSLEIPADGGIPPFLARAADAPPLAPPPLAPAPPAPPAPPPVGVLGPKVVAALDALKEGKPDGGQALADWLSAAGLTIKGATYDEACRVVLMSSDEKLKAIAEALKIAA
jgi:hypothetical protein